MYGIKCQQDDFEINMCLDQGQIQLLQDGVMWRGLIMRGAEFCTGERFVWETKEERVTIVRVGRDKAVDKDGCGE